MDKPSAGKPVQHLVLDTGAIIANVNLHTLADFYYAPSDVLSELRSKKALANFEKLPFDVKIVEPSSSSIKAVIDASKQTGDYKSLSVADLRVLALTYQLSQQHVKNASVAEDVPESIAEVSEAIQEKISSEVTENTETSDQHEEEPTDNDIPDGFCEDPESSDEEGWINEDNLADALKKMGAFEVSEKVVVGCLSTDFALQNVLLFMHLGLVSLSGLRIRKLKSFLLRCRACFNTTTNMEKEFCPSCGNKTLHKCAVSVGEDGEQVLHVNWNRLQIKRGLKYSLAAPKGGKHAFNEKLFEDQRMPQNRMAKVRNDPLADGPFAMHDITSRSAMLGIRTTGKGGRKNPNESRGHRRKT